MSSVKIAAENGGYSWSAMKGDLQIAHGWVRGSKSNARAAAAQALADIERAARATP